MKKISTSDLKYQHIFGLILGSSKSGKTTLASTLDEKKTLIIAVENGLLSLKHVNMQAWLIESTEDLQDVFQSIPKEIDTLMFDSLTEIGEMFFSEMKPNYTKNKTFDLYTDYSEKIIKFIKYLRDLHQYNIWLTAVEKEGDDGLPRIDLVQKSLHTVIAKYFDMILRLKVVTTEENSYRVLTTEDDDVPIVGVRGNINGVLERFEKPDLGLLTNKIMKGDTNEKISTRN